jgi:hypothetical protein
MVRTAHYCLFASLAALLLLTGANRADEPKKEPEKKEPEKKKPAEVPANLDVAKVLEMVQKLREARARMQAAENLRKLKLAPPQPREEPKKEPEKTPPTPGTYPLYQHLLPYIEQDNLWRSATVTVGGAGDRMGVSLEPVGPVLQPLLIGPLAGVAQRRPDKIADIASGFFDPA